MSKQFLDLTGLTTFLNQLKGLFATQNVTTGVEADMDIYLLNIDYSILEFDTSEIIS